MTTPILSLRDVTCRLGGQPVVRAVSLDLEPGQFVALIGPNGAGKSTLMRALAGLLPSEGEIHIEGRDVSTLSRPEIAKRIGYLPQGQAIHWPLAAREIVALGRYPHGLIDPAQMTEPHRHAVALAMQRTDCAHLADRSVLSLSGGERARVLLARALAVEAPILLADEPTAALDPRHQLTVMEDLRAESRRGTLVMAVTHDLGLAARLADRIILLDQGRLVAAGSPAEVLTDERIHAVYGIRVLRQIIDGEQFITPRSAL